MRGACGLCLALILALGVSAARADEDWTAVDDVDFSPLLAPVDAIEPARVAEDRQPPKADEVPEKVTNSYVPPEAADGDEAQGWTAVDDVDLNRVLLAPIDAIDPLRLAERRRPPDPDELAEKVLNSFVEPPEVADDDDEQEVRIGPVCKVIGCANSIPVPNLNLISDPAGLAAGGNAAILSRPPPGLLQNVPIPVNVPIVGN